MKRVCSDTILNNNEYTVLEKANGDCYIKDKKTGRFFFKEKLFASKSHLFDEITKPRWVYKDTLFSLLIICSFYLLWYSVVNVSFIQTQMGMMQSVWSLIFLGLNILLHECGHAVALLTFGGRPGKIKLKWYYFLPLISIDTSDVYIMPRYRGVFVCYAGVMVNIYLCALVALLRPDIGYVIAPIYTLILFSLLPFSGVKTDGYNLFIRLLLQINDIKGKKSKLSKMLELCLNITLIALIAHFFYGFLT